MTRFVLALAALLALVGVSHAGYGRGYVIPTQQVAAPPVQLAAPACGAYGCNLPPQQLAAPAPAYAPLVQQQFQQSYYSQQQFAAAPVYVPQQQFAAPIYGGYSRGVGLGVGVGYGRGVNVGVGVGYGGVGVSRFGFSRFSGVRVVTPGAAVIVQRGGLFRRRGVIVVR